MKVRKWKKEKKKKKKKKNETYCFDLESGLNIATASCTS